MKEIETLVEEKKKDSSELTKIVAPPEGKYPSQITGQSDVIGAFAPQSLMVYSDVSYVNKTTT